MQALRYFTKKRCITFYHRLKYTFGNLTVHGPSFLVRKDVHIIYRFIYLIIYIQVWFSAVATILKYYNHYQENTIRFTPQTDYLKWNTTFASITVCESENVDKITAIRRQLNENIKFDQLYGDIAFFTGTCYSCLSTFINESMRLEEIEKISSKYRASCEELFLSCKWNNEPIECCKHFLPIQTEYGLCYSINNKQSSGQAKQFMYVVSTNQQKMSSLELVLSQDYEAFLHSLEDVPFWNMEYDRRIRVLYGSEAVVTYSIMDVVNEPEVLLTSPHVRQCRFPHEVPENFIAFKHYSYSTCIIQCRIEAQIHLCNCVNHLSPSIYKDRFCDLDGLKCLTNNNELLRKLKVPQMNNTALECDCLSSCTEPDYNVVAKKLEEPRSNLQVGKAVFVLGNKPNQRVRRQVARTALDLVVAIGNCFGLCFGGSLLSIVEIIYYLCLKNWKARETKKNNNMDSSQ